MKLRRKYIDLDDTLRAFKMQVKDSLDFAADYLPSLDMTPREIYNHLRRDVVYINDPPGVELIQSMPTMFSYNNPHNIYGAGDCDCMSVAASACLIVSGLPVNIALVGRTPDNAVHIYCMTGNHAPVVPFDLTNAYYSQERKYPYKQTLPLLITF